MQNQTERLCFGHPPRTTHTFDDSLEGNQNMVVLMVKTHFGDRGRRHSWLSKRNRRKWGVEKPVCGFPMPPPFHERSHRAHLPFGSEHAATCV